MTIDCNVSLGHWPFQYTGIATARRLDRHLRRFGVGRALVSSADAVLFPEPGECNTRLREELRPFPSLVPVPVLNPRNSSAREILAEPGLRAVKLIPNYHAYRLTDPCALQAIREARRLGVTVMVQMRMEDERGQYELLKVPGVSVADIASAIAEVPGLSLVALCPYFAEVVALAKLPGVSADISFAERPDTVTRLCREVPATRLLFGSHSPWHYTAAARAKLASAEIGADERRAIEGGNASRLFGLED